MGKDNIPYEMITRYDSLDITPENGQSFLPHQFYSSLKDSTMTDEEYGNVKKILLDNEIGKFWRTQ